MSAQTMSEAFAPAEAKYREEMMHATWGHLAPVKDRIYYGHIVFAVGCFGNDPLNPVILTANFRGLMTSPWFFDALTEFVSSRKRTIGAVYRFDGCFKNYVFRGTMRKLRLVIED